MRSEEDTVLKRTDAREHLRHFAAVQGSGVFATRLGDTAHRGAGDVILVVDTNRSFTLSRENRQLLRQEYNVVEASFFAPFSNGSPREEVLRDEDVELVLVVDDEEVINVHDDRRDEVTLRVATKEEHDVERAAHEADAVEAFSDFVTPDCWSVCEAINVADDHVQHGRKRASEKCESVTWG